jgi:hypothetical protein
MHFKNQHALIVRGMASISKSKRLPSVEGLTHRAERRESHPPDTDGRLLTEMSRAGRICSRLSCQPHFRDQGLIDIRPNAASEIRQLALHPTLLKPTALSR